MLLGLTAPAQATEHEVADYGDILRACYGIAKDSAERETCHGEMSRECMNSQDGGHTTLGMTSCLYAEGKVWDELLNAEYRETMAWAKSADDDDREYSPGFAHREETLRAAQRAWITFRDAECAFDYAQWGSGSMRNIAGADCVTTMTAERTIELRDMREMFQ